MSYQVLFCGVGRKHATFSTTLLQLDHRTLLAAVRPHLMSQDIEFSLDDEKQHGLVIVGGFRQLGEFTWEKT